MNGGEPALAQLGRHDPLESGTSGVQVANRRSFDAGCPCVGRAHGHGEVHGETSLGRVESHQARRGGSGTDGSPGAVGVNFGAHLGGGADARGNLVTDDDAFQHLSTAASQLFPLGDGAGCYVDGGMSAAQSVAFVHLQRDAGGGIC